MNKDEEEKYLASLTQEEEICPKCHAHFVCMCDNTKKMKIIWSDDPQKVARTLSDCLSPIETILAERIDHPERGLINIALPPSISYAIDELRDAHARIKEFVEKYYRHM